MVVLVNTTQRKRRVCYPQLPNHRTPPKPWERGRCRLAMNHLHRLDHRHNVNIRDLGLVVLMVFLMVRK
ncbi:hypothetical protein Hanom_Chr12g01174561 [Helianthus anomalus]